MKKLVSGIIVATALAAAGSAHSADMAQSVYKAPSQPRVYNWSGFYVGGNAGYAWGKSDTFTSLSNLGTTGVLFAPSALVDINRNLGALGLSDSGLTYGLQAGINIQTGNWVWGAELDLNSVRLSDVRARTFAYTGAFAGNSFSVTDSLSTDWVLTGRGRLGFAADNWLFYGTGGIATTKMRYQHTFSDAFLNRENSAIDRSKVGWTIGGGVEYGIGNWSVKAEYLYMDFGTENVAGPVTSGTLGSVNSAFAHSADLTAQTVRVGLNYRFGDYGKAPVVAKY